MNGTQARIMWFENIDGMGTFGERQVFSNFGLELENLLRDVEFDDMDNDGIKDVVATSNSQSSTGDNFIFWMKHLDGLGTFDE